MAGLVKSAGLIGAELVLGLDSGEIIECRLGAGAKGPARRSWPAWPQG